MVQSTTTRGQSSYPGCAAHDVKEKAREGFEKLADQATDQFKNIADKAEYAASRVAEQGREAGERVQEVAGNFKGAVDRSVKDQLKFCALRQINFLPDP